MKMQLAQVAQAVAANLEESAAQVVVSSVSYDTRKLQAGALFVPLIGQNDGHQFVLAAQANGAVATLWQKDHEVPADLTIPVIKVDNTLTALQQLAHDYLLKINPKVVAITGSNGKTTTKDMVAAILGSEFNVHKTHANFNNQIGVPETILTMEANTEILVVEMGMDHFGELDLLSKLTQPDVAVITMIGEAHIEFFKTRDKIADAKMEITHGLKEDGTLVFNGDEPLLLERTQTLVQNCVKFGRHEANALQATNIVSDQHQTSFRVTKWDDINFTIPMLGAYNVNNALAALAVGELFHIDAEKMQQALAAFHVTKNRTQWLETKNGMRVLSDVYNSNPTAVKNVLAAFSAVPSTGRRIVVLGDMLELGEASVAMHEQIAADLDPTLIDSVYLCGAMMQHLATKLTAKFAPQKIHHYQKDDKDKLIADLIAATSADDVVLLKASHGIHLEVVVDALLKNA